MNADERFYTDEKDERDERDKKRNWEWWRGGVVRRLTRFESDVMHGALGKAEMPEVWREIAAKVSDVAGVPVLFAAFGMDQQWGERDTVPRMAFVVADDEKKAVLEGQMRGVSRVAADHLRERMATAQWVDLMIPTVYSVTGLEAIEAAVKEEQDRRNFAPRLAKKYSERIHSMSEYAAGVFHVFYRTDDGMAAALSDGFHKRLKQEVLEQLHEVGQTGYTAEKLTVEAYSDEAVEREFGGRMQDFYR